MATHSNILTWKIPWTDEHGGLQSMARVLERRRQWHPTPVLLPGKSHGRRSLVGCRLGGCTESDTTEQLHFHFSLSCIGDGNGNPLQCSCLDNPRDGGASWAAVYGVAESRTRLKRLSSSSSKRKLESFDTTLRASPAIYSLSEQRVRCNLRWVATLSKSNCGRGFINTRSPQNN